MIFPNAFEGVKKIYTAEVMSIVAALFSVIAGIVGALGNGAVVGGAAVVLIAALVMIIAKCMNIIGVNRASKDEPAFKNALIALFVGVAANVLVTSFSDNSFLSSLGNTLANITEFLASFFVCTGVVNLADRLGNAEVSDKGKSTRKLLMGTWLTSAVLNFVSAIFSKNGTMLNIVGAISIVAAIVSIISYILYIGMLSKAKKMLA